MDRFFAGVAMARASWGVLRSDRELMVFPAVSLVVVGFLYYLTLYSVVIFCNVAVVAGALIRLQGGDPTVSDGFGAAFDRLPAIIGYAAIAATVGMVLRYLSERTGLIGLAALALLGTTLQAVFTASVYRYAVTGQGGSMFPTATVQGAFRTND